MSLDPHEISLIEDPMTCYEFDATVNRKLSRTYDSIHEIVSSVDVITNFYTDNLFIEMNINREVTFKSFESHHNCYIYNKSKYPVHFDGFNMKLVYSVPNFPSLRNLVKQRKMYYLYLLRSFKSIAEDNFTIPPGKIFIPSNYILI